MSEEATTPDPVELTRRMFAATSLEKGAAWANCIITHVVSSGDTPEARAAAERLAESRA